jgi:hypothetical protein
MIGKLRPLRNVASRNWIQNNIRRNLEESCSAIFASHGATIFFKVILPGFAARIASNVFR